MADHNCVVEICAAWERTILTVQGRYPGVDVDRMRRHIQHLREEQWKAATWGESLPLVDYHSINSAALEEVTAAVFSLSNNEERLALMVLESSINEHRDSYAVESRG